ncbi:MAG: hypothetical protein RL556_791 [Actinomycetota bacterium]|jgi:basic membrane protein A
MKLAKSVAVVLASALALAGCSARPDSVLPTPVNVTACILGDQQGLDDHSVGSSAYLGMLQAQAQYGVKLRVAKIAEGSTDADKLTAYKNLLKKGCSIMVGVGDAADVFENQASAHANLKFILVHGRSYSLGDASGVRASKLSNVKSISYQSEQGGFLAGYLAASQSQSGKVAAFGSSLTRTETSLLAGFYLGVQYANEVQGKAVEVLGHNRGDVWQAVGKNDSEAARTTTIQYLSDGADVIFPVVGDSQADGAALSALTLIQANDAVSMIGSVTDWYKNPSAREVRDRLLASVTLSIQQDVANAIGTAVAGTFVGGTEGSILGNLDNTGVSITGAHSIAYPQSFNLVLSQLIQDIKDGKVVVKSNLR